MSKFKVTHQLGEDIVEHPWGPALKEGDLAFMTSGEVITAYEKNFWLKVEKVDD